ncbi:MAG: hypothetical protein NTV87_13305 [Ignavibacteriae bacterium]|nr:hypothetical protein [Ignavibacteriota bacterium]
MTDSKQKEFYDGCNDDERYIIDERAGIYEYDAEIERPKAELAALYDLLLHQLIEQRAYDMRKSHEQDGQAETVNVQDLPEEEFINHMEMKYYKKHPWLRAEVMILNEGMEKVILNGIDITEHVKKEIGRK